MATREQEAYWDYVVARRRVLRDPSLPNVTAYNTTLLVASAHVLAPPPYHATLDDESIDVLKIHAVERRFRAAELHRKK